MISWKPKFAYLCHLTNCHRKCCFKPWDNAVGLKGYDSNFEIRLFNLLIMAIIFGDSCCGLLCRLIQSLYSLGQSGNLWCHETHVSTNESACFGWSICVHNKPRDSRWRTNLVASAFQFYECGPSRGIIYISNWVKYCRNYIIKGIGNASLLCVF